MSMQFKDMNEIDLKLSLLSGGGIQVGNLEIKPYTLKEIRNYGHSRYMGSLQWLSITVDDFINSVSDDNKRDILEKQREQLKAFDFYIKLGGKDFLEKLITGLKMVLKTNDVRFLDDGVIAVDFVKLGILNVDSNNEIVSMDSNKLDSLREDEIIIINRDNFDDIVNIAKLQNYLEKPQVKSEDNPADDETRKLMEHMKEMREKVEAKKKRQKQQDEGGDIDISDIVSAVSSKSNSINKLNIWSLTLYQLYDEYSRLELIDNYDFSIRAMMAGAEKVDLRHWSSKL
jgi:hypothetical protein